MGNLFDRIENRGPMTRKIVLPLDSEAVEAVTKALQRQSRAILGSEQDKETADRELDEARARLREASVTIRVQAISPEDWDALQRAHPPTSQQVEEARKEMGPMASVAWNVDTFVAAGWEACQVPDEGDERLSYEQCSQLLKRFSQGEKVLLLQTIRQANEGTITPDALGE